MKNQVAIATKPNTSIHLYGGATDMRLGLPGLVKKVKSELRKDVSNGGLYIFVARDRHRVKLLYWDENGYAIWYKYMPTGVFQVEEREGYQRITAINLKSLLQRPGKKLIELKEAA